MELGAFISLEDISCDLPTYTEHVIGIEMDPPCVRPTVSWRKTSGVPSRNIAAVTR